ncbi:ECF-type sigma factor [Phascolarctobacterium sp.]|uniref:ECF-type sigma factor n=1 Tax=Phascolarctobacterium sp. TaxID=2049039 RepID=UPI00386FC501
MSPAKFHNREAFVSVSKNLSIFYAQKRRWRCRSPPPVSEFQTKFRNSEDTTMAYNKASEERKWRLWKEAEEKQLRELGVSEEKIAQLRAYDWEMFNSDRRYYEHHAEGGDYLEQLAASEEEPDAKTVSDFLNGIDSPVLFRLLSETDPITILIALRRSQGKSFAEISLEIGLSENTAHRRWTRLKEKIKKSL